MSDSTFRVPKDPEKRAQLARMAGLTEEEEAAINQWCAEQAREYEARKRRALERLADEPMAQGGGEPNG